MSCGWSRESGLLWLMSSGGCKRRAREQRRASAFQWPTRSGRCKSSVHERLEGRGGVTGVARMTDHRKLIVGDGGRACAFVCTKWVLLHGFHEALSFLVPRAPCLHTSPLVDSPCAASQGRVPVATRERGRGGEVLSLPATAAAANDKAVDGGSEGEPRSATRPRRQRGA